MTKIEDAETAAPRTARPTLDSAKTLKPVKWWAFVGVVYLSICAYSATRWLLGGYAHQPPRGPDPLPTYMAVGIAIWVVIFALAVGVGSYYALVKPWRRERRLSTDGLLFLAIITLWFQDPLPNYSQLIWNYNAATPSLGCPMCFMPGWQGNSNYVNEGLFAMLFYFGLVWLSIRLGVRMMHWYAARWPRSAKLGPVLFVFALVVLFDLVTEVLWILPGLYSWGGVTKGPGPILFAGHYYQVPLVEIVFAGAWYAVFCVIAYYRNDRGEIFAEHGIVEVRGTQKQKTLLRFLALVGIMNLGAFVVYNLPMGWIAGHYSTWPEDVYSRSYFTGGNCGQGTAFACPDSRIPIRTGRDSLYVDPRGNVVVPRGLPDQSKP